MPLVCGLLALVCGQYAQQLFCFSYVEGENIVIEYRWAEGRFDRLPVLAEELVRRQVAVIVAPNTNATLAAKAATTTTPIVFAVATR
jgi:putative ABC transport system substrate-binding protein